MKRQVRYGVFETNSSSTHSLTICSGEQYDKWQKGEVLFNVDSYFNKLEQFPTKKEVINYLKSQGELNDENDELELDDALRNAELYTEDIYFNDEYLEGFAEEHTTENGDKVVAFGKYGMDG